MNEQEAREWMRYELFDWRMDEEEANRYNLTPILDDLERVLTHIDAERERIGSEDKVALAAEQARVNQLPRHRWRVTFDPEPDAHWYHRTPIDCWAPGRYGPVTLNGVAHGELIERDDHTTSDALGCICIRSGIIEATDEYADWWRSCSRSTIERDKSSVSRDDNQG